MPRGSLDRLPTRQVDEGDVTDDANNNNNNGAREDVESSDLVAVSCFVRYPAFV